MRTKEGLILYAPPSLVCGLSDEQGRREAMTRTTICLHKGVRVPDVPYLRIHTMWIYIWRCGSSIFLIRIIVSK